MPGNRCGYRRFPDGRFGAAGNMDRLGGGRSRVLRQGVGGGRLGGGNDQLPGDTPSGSSRCPARELLIGRRSTSRNIHPEIDLTSPPGGPPTDTGVSREHARLLAVDGTWSVVDLRTSNGTQVNGQDIPSGVMIQLHDGDRINLGSNTS